MTPTAPPGLHRSFTPFAASVAAAVCLLGALMQTGCTKESAAKPPPMPVASPVVVAQAQKRDVPLKVESVATAKPFIIINVKPQISGMIVQKLFTAGQWVDKGFVLYRLDDRPYRAELEQAVARMARDQALAEHAKSEADRKTELARTRSASPWEAEQATTTYKAAVAQVEADKAEIEQIKLKIEYCEIKAPIDGYLGPTITYGNNVVKENETLMVVIHQITPIYVEMAVPQRHLADVRRAMAQAAEAKAKDAKAAGVPFEVLLPDDVNGEAIGGELLFINNTVDEETGTLVVRGVFPNKDRRLWPGQYLRGRLTIGVLKDAVVIPAAALQESQNGTYVFIVKPDNTVEMRPVTAGTQLKEQIVVTKGLSGGETVVTEGQLRLIPGAKVELNKPAADSKPQQKAAT